MGKPKDVEPQPDLTGKTAIVTGANVGIGYATALHLASLNCRIILACRNTQKAQKAVDDIKRVQPKANLEIYTLDLQSLESARQFQREWAEKNTSEESQKVDLLICNAGATFLERKMTSDGFEQGYQTNYLTHFLLVRLMLPYLRHSADPRIICVSSKAASWGKVAMDNMNAEAIPESSWKGLSGAKTGMQVYGNTKLMQIMQVIYMQKLLQASSIPEDHRISLHAVFPGFVASDMAQKEHYGLPKFLTTGLGGLVKMFGRTITVGAKPTLWAALSAEAGDPVKTGGSYIDENCNIVDYPNAQCKDGALMQELYERSCKDTSLETAL